MPTYADLPLLKKPVWTWEVPAYFFAGGAAGAAAVIALTAQVGRGNERLARDARWIAAIGAAVSGPLLIADLGRPERFLNMMRVFKPQSPMSVGAWTLAAFGGASAAAVIPNRTLRSAAGVVSAATGLVMCTYTGVLIGATAIPAWKKNVKLLPVLFGASALASAVSLLELRGHRAPALNSLALGAAIFETAADPGWRADTPAGVPRSQTGVSAPNGSHPTTIGRLAGVLSGPIPLLLRLLGSRKLAAASALAGSLATRIAWIEAGKASASAAGVALDQARA